MHASGISGKEIINIEGTSETPEILLNSREGVIRFSGRSLPENPKTFFNPIKEWLAEYAKNPAPTTHVSFIFDYFNTASSKLIMEIIDIIKTVEENDSKLIIDWHYQEDDEDMLEAGEDFEAVTGVNFNYISYP